MWIINSSDALPALKCILWTQSRNRGKTTYSACCHKRTWDTFFSLLLEISKGQTSTWIQKLILNGWMYVCCCVQATKPHITSGSISHMFVVWFSAFNPQFYMCISGRASVTKSHELTVAQILYHYFTDESKTARENEKYSLRFNDGKKRDSHIQRTRRRLHRYTLGCIIFFLSRRVLQSSQWFLV